MMEASAQQAKAANLALEEMKETQAKLTARINELQWENQFLNEMERKMQYDPCNPEIKENEVDEEVHRPEVEQPRQKTPLARLVEIPHPVERMAHSEHHMLKSNEVKLEDLEDQKQQIMAEMTKKIGGYNKFTNPLDLVVMAT